MYAEDGISRAAVQTTMCNILYNYISVLTPLIPLITEEAWAHTPENLKAGIEGPGQLGWFEPNPQWYDETAKALSDDFHNIKPASDAVLHGLEDLRDERKVRDPVMADVILVMEEGSPAWKLFKSLGQFYTLCYNSSFIIPLRAYSLSLGQFNVIRTFY